jgi:two-component system nitrogen regulation response regulator GlnG
MRTRWIHALARETKGLLTKQPGTVFRIMSLEFEATLISCALAASGGCRVDAARLLGIGRNTITRKIHAFGLDSIDASLPGAQQSLFRSRRDT